MDNIQNAKNAISQLLAENASVGVIASGHQDTDLLAAALSLHLILQDSGKSSQVVSPKDPTVEHSFLVGIDQIAKNFSGVTKTLTVSFPYNEGDIEKVSYNIEGDRLNVNLFAEEAGIHFTEKDIKYVHQGSSPQLIFTIGVAQPSEIQEILGQGSHIVNIDNLPSNGMFGEVNIVDPSYSSLSEMVAKLAQDLQLQLEFDVAQNLLDGITSATQSFSSPKTSPLAFEMAGFLMQKGAVRKSMKEARKEADTSLQMLGKQDNKQQLPNGQKQAPKQQFNQSKPRQDAAFNGNPLVNSPQQNPFSQSMDQQSSQSNQSRPSQPQAIPNPQADQSQEDIQNLPSEDEAPSDWFTPKVFKSTRNQS